MKIRKIEIKKYRSLYDVTIHVGDVLALIGRNNSGKSNVIKALELFFESSIRLINDECFHNHSTKDLIEIFITFEELNNREKEQFKPWLYGDKLIVGKQIVCSSTGEYSIINLAVTEIPEAEWLREDAINSDKISEWWAKKDELKINDLDFVTELGPSKPGVSKWKEAAKEFLDLHHNRIPMKEELLQNPKGYPGVLKGTLPRFIYIPAVRDVLEEIKVTKSNPFGQLVNSVLEKIAGEQKEAISQQLKQIEKLLNRGEGKERIGEIKDIEVRLNKLMSELMDCDIEIEMAMPQLKDVFGAAKIYADDGVRTTIETKGHGMQRSMILTILRAYAELAHTQENEEEPEGRSTIFAIEEPELYLHPQSQRTLMSVFQVIGKGNDQVIYSTHSSLFIDISQFDQICIMRREKRDNAWESNATQLLMQTMLEDLKARKGIDGTEKGMRELYSHAFNPMINEGFFADKVVVVEGPSEQYALPVYAVAFGYDLDRNNISVVHSNGKGQMDRLLRLFNGFEIPTYLWFDGDKYHDECSVKEKTLELLKLVGNQVERIEDVTTTISNNYTVLENKFENTLEEELPDYQELMKQAAERLGPTGKPLTNRFIATELKRRIEGGQSPEHVLPKTIIYIIQRIKELSYSGTILQKLTH